MAQTTPDLRAQAVSALRQIADLIETHPKLPVPTTGYVAAYLTTSEYPTEQGRFTALRQVADILGAEVVEFDSCRETRSELGLFSLIINAPRDTIAPPQDGRIVPAQEDAR